MGCFYWKYIHKETKELNFSGALKTIKDVLNYTSLYKDIMTNAILSFFPKNTRTYRPVLWYNDKFLCEESDVFGTWQLGGNAKNKDRYLSKELDKEFIEKAIELNVPEKWRKEIK